MIGRLSALLMGFEMCFARQATFRWFVVAVMGFIVRLDRHGVSSSVRWLRVRPELYEAFLAFFRSKAVRLESLLQQWQRLVAQRSALRTESGAFVLVGDGIKVAKEASRMPGVKKLHQESENSGKPSWILGHHFGIVGLLGGTPDKVFCIPLAAELHEGAPALRQLQAKKEPVVDGVNKSTVVTLMGHLVKTVAMNLAAPCVAVLDAYFSVGSTFQIAKTLCAPGGQRLLHVVTRAKDNAVAYEDRPGEYGGRGRPRKHGRKMVLDELFFTRKDCFKAVTLSLYDEVKTVSILCLDRLWRPIDEKLRWVLVIDGEHRFILMCSDLMLSPVEILRLYASRFKIEVTFKTIKHIMGGFLYHFWTSAWLELKGKSLSVEHLKGLPEKSKHLIADAMTAIELFVNIALIATGMLQILAIEHTEQIRKRHCWWMRTYSSEVPSEEMVKTLIQHEFYHHFRFFRHTAIYRIIRAKAAETGSDKLRMAA